MPRPSKGPYLYWNKREQTWWIRDRQKVIRTGCGKDSVDDARRKLAAYIGRTVQPDTSGHHPDTVRLMDCIHLYAQTKIPALPTKRQRNQLAYALSRLIDFAGTDTLSAINGPWCRAYWKWSSTQSMARNDLAFASAATRFYQKEVGLTHAPIFTLPPKCSSRDRHLSRSDTARLLLEMRRMGVSYLARYVLIGIYSGTRSTAILRLRWQPSIGSGYVDLERGIIHRAAADAKRTNKRQPPCVIPNRLLAHMRRWKRLDDQHGIQHVIHKDSGIPLKSVYHSWRLAREAAGLSDGIVPHILRHTAITWAMQRGVNINLVSSYFGVSVPVLESTYWHHSPAYQEQMRKLR